MALIEATNIVKIYPNGVLANDGVNLSVEQGEIHALVGENGAGKSTLMKFFYGLEQPTSGQIILRDQPVAIHNPTGGDRPGDRHGSPEFHAGQFVYHRRKYRAGPRSHHAAGLSVDTAEGGQRYRSPLQTVRPEC